MLGFWIGWFLERFLEWWSRWGVGVGSRRRVGWWVEVWRVVVFAGGWRIGGFVGVRRIGFCALRCGLRGGRSLILLLLGRRALWDQVVSLSKRCPLVPRGTR